MAKAGDKHRLEANQRKLVLLRTGILAAIAVHVVVRLILYRSSVSKRTIFGFVATGAIEAFCYRALALLAGKAHIPVPLPKQTQALRDQDLINGRVDASFPLAQCPRTGNEGSSLMVVQTWRWAASQPHTLTPST